MELGDGRIGWFKYVPKFNGNRELPEAERLSLEIRKLRTIDWYAQDDSETALLKWRDERMAKWLADETPEAAAIRQLTPPILRAMRQFVDHTRAFKNFFFDGVEITDPVEIFLRMPIPADPSWDYLVGEVNNAVTEASRLYGDRLKNYLTQCASGAAETGPTSRAASAAPPALGDSPPSLLS